MIDVVIVGAGLAGLTCAQDLARAGLHCSLVEASDGVGGRVRTDTVDGYRLDRGFQVVLTAYPQVRKRFDLGALELCLFEPGALVRRGGRFRVVGDPLRRPLQLPQTLVAPIGSLMDKARLARMILDVRRHSVPDLLRRSDMTTSERLANAGFSDRMIESFWQPLFAGIQLDPLLEVSSRRFDVILRMLAVGSTAVPRLGMGALAAQLASTLPDQTVRLGARVARVDEAGVVLDDGERIDARTVVVATEGPTAHRLLGNRVADPGSRAVGCCWFAAPSAPLAGRTLVLDGEASGPAKNVAVMSGVSPSYAPPGRALIAAAVPGDEALDPGVTTRVREQLTRWFDSATTDWEHLRTDVIAHGQPAQAPPFSPKQRVALGGGLFVCGDHRDTASTQGAMYSGERTAAAVLRHLHGGRAQVASPDGDG